ncbi:hypothetical protein GGTG_11384 [Gaeumannomyces tritici R3-111a-1]|uniref:Uncharacterized protein n=1 Tax=Gaeumannomyces tritici (strain R3-111a-1) TaxID=644352 RepID=J3PD11_GAET3|nr:hypothetical protein GGTG_11384 [Gaeumannomyces tritici R3-111a-1]EJT70356.1 hypothetical protein GGTG_11384 [Gaeumannomyces tritici R3-111a-1]
MNWQGPRRMYKPALFFVPLMPVDLASPVPDSPLRHSRALAGWWGWAFPPGPPLPPPLV